MTSTAGESPLILAVDGLTVSYDGAVAVSDLSLSVRPRTLTALLGPNGAGKTTLLSAIAGLIEPRSGTIRLRDKPITGVPAHRVSRAGVRLVPETRALFPDMSVADNLAVGLGRAPRSTRASRLERVLTIFPVLGQRLAQTTGTMSGGEQQMLSIARALVAEPAVLLLDEPSMGLAPLVVTAIIDAVAELRDDGLTVVVAEQNARSVLRVADEAVLMAHGVVVASGPADQIAARIEREGYLGEAQSVGAQQTDDEPPEGAP